jgi:hypothetical protein
MTYGAARIVALSYVTDHPSLSEWIFLERNGWRIGRANAAPHDDDAAV